jgi:glycine cleavage system H protein
LDADGNLPCIWMTAGLVAYKLCDRSYDCEGCPFDEVLHGGARRAPDSRASRVQATRWEFPDDRRYHSSHGWIQAIDEARVRYGVDAFAVRLLDQLTAVILPPVDSPLQRGHSAAWVRDAGHLIPLASPITGTVLRINGAVQRDPSLVTTSPYNTGWLLEVRCEGGVEQQQSGLLTGQDLKHKTLLYLEQLRQEGRHEMGRDEGIGATLADGGEPEGDVRGALGAQEYRRAVCRLLS